MARTKVDEYLQLADRQQVLGVIEYWACTGCSLGQALQRKGVGAKAFYARVNRGEPDVRAAFEAAKAQWSFAAMDATLQHANEQVEAHGHPTWGLIRARQVEKMAKALAPGLWSERGQVEAAGLPQQARLSLEDLGPQVVELRDVLRQRLLVGSKS